MEGRGSTKISTLQVGLVEIIVVHVCSSVKTIY